MATQQIRVTCPRCPEFLVWAAIDGPVSKDTVGLMREIVLGIHVRDYHPTCTPVRAKMDAILASQSRRVR